MSVYSPLFAPVMTTILSFRSGMTLSQHLLEPPPMADGLKVK